MLMSQKNISDINQEEIVIIVIMILSVLTAGQLVAVSYKAFGTASAGNNRIVPAFMAFWGSILGLIMLILAFATGGFEPSTATLIAAPIAGLAFVVAAISLVHVLATGPFIWSTLLLSLSNFLPVLFALAFLGESISVPQTIGVFVILSILFVMNVGLKNDNRPFTSTWMIMGAVMMLANGSALSAQKAQTHVIGDGEVLEFLAIMFISASIINFIYYLVSPGKKEKFKFRIYLPPAIGLIIGMAAVNLISMFLMARISAAVQFPISVGGGIVLSSILGVILYKEKVGWRLFISAALLISGVVLLGL